MFVSKTSFCFSENGFQLLSCLWYRLWEAKLYLQKKFLFCVLVNKLSSLLKILFKERIKTLSKSMLPDWNKQILVNGLWHLFCFLKFFFPHSQIIWLKLLCKLLQCRCSSSNVGATISFFKMPVKMFIIYI